MLAVIITSNIEGVVVMASSCSTTFIIIIPGHTDSHSQVDDVRGGLAAQRHILQADVMVSQTLLLHKEQPRHHL